MEMLVEAASALNPKQFELPRSMSVPCMFPGRDKSKKFSFVADKGPVTLNIVNRFIFIIIIITIVIYVLRLLIIIN